MTTRNVNPYETAARERKARALANQLYAGGITVEMARGMRPGQWHMAALAARVPEPSAFTVALVIEQLDAIERAAARERDADPFRGF